jgi:hypothetical protein
LAKVVRGKALPYGTHDKFVNLSDFGQGGQRGRPEPFALLVHTYRTADRLAIDPKRGVSVSSDL